MRIKPVLDRRSDQPTAILVVEDYGLTPRLYKSGETMRVGRVLKCGNTERRAALYEAALMLLTGFRK